MTRGNLEHFGRLFRAQATKEAQLDRLWSAKSPIGPQVAVSLRTFGRAILTFMWLLVDWLKASWHLIRTTHRVLLDCLRLVARACRSRSAVEAENLFLRKQLALFQERNLRPRRADDSTR